MYVGVAGPYMAFALRAIFTALASADGVVDTIRVHYLKFEGSQHRERLTRNGTRTACARFRPEAAFRRLEFKRVPAITVLTAV